MSNTTSVESQIIDWSARAGSVEFPKKRSRRAKRKIKAEDALTRYFGGRLAFNRARTERLLGDNSAAGRKLHFETLEPRLLLSADTFVGATLAGYYADADKDLGPGFVDDLVSGVGSVGGLVDNVLDNATADFVDALDIKIPGLLNRFADDGTTPLEFDQFSAPDLGDLLDLPTELAGSAATDQDGDGDIDFADIVDQYVYDVINALGGTVQASALISALHGTGPIALGDFTLDIDALFNFNADPDTAPGGTDPSATAEYTIDLTLDLRRSDNFKLDLGRNADIQSLDYGADDPSASSALPTVALESFFRFKLTLGLDATLQEDTDRNPAVDGPDEGNDPTDDFDPQLTITTTGFFVRDGILSAGAHIDADNLDFGLRFGFLDIEIVDGTFELDAAVTAEINDGDTEVAQSDLTLTNVEFPDPSGSATITLPVTVEAISGAPDFVSGIASYLTGAGLTPTITLQSSDIFTDSIGPLGTDDPRTALFLSLDEFGALLNFRNLDATALIGLLNDLSTFLDNFETIAAMPGGTEALFGLPIPFADNLQVSDLLDFGAQVDELLDGLAPFSGGVPLPTFESFQDFVGDLLSLGANDAIASILPTFIGATSRLEFSLNFEATIVQTDPIPFDFNLDLGPVADVTVVGELGFDSDLTLAFTFGLDLAGATEISVVSAFASFGLVSLIPASGANPVPTTGVLAADAKFRLDFGNSRRVDVTILADDTDGTNGAAFTTLQELADHLKTEIQGAISDFNMSNAADEADIFIAVDVNVLGDTALGTQRLQILTVDTNVANQANDTPFLKITNLPLDPDVPAVLSPGFSELGFVNGQRAASSPLPQNGILSADATFSLTIDGTTHPITVAKADTLDNTAVGTTTADFIANLAQDIKDAINDEFGDGTVTVTLDDKSLSFKILPADTVKFLALDAANTIAENELGLSDDTISSKLLVTGDRNLDIVPLAADAVPAGGVLLSNQSFTLELGNADGTISETVTVLASSTTDNDDAPTDALTSATRLANDLNAALRTTFDNNGVPLSAYVVANADEIDGSPGTYGIRLSAPFGTFDTLEVIGANALVRDVLATVQGPHTTGDVDGCSFTLELVNVDGSIQSALISLAVDSTGIPDIVDDLNTAIGASTLAGDIVVALSQGRLVFAATASAIAAGAENIRIVTPDADAIAKLGLNDGMNGRVRDGIEAFLDGTFSADFEVSGKAAGAANFGFVGITFGDVDNFDPNIDSTVGLDGSITGSVEIDLTGDLSLSDLIGALDDLNELDDLLTGGFAAAVDISGSASFTIDDIGIEGSDFGGIAADLLAELNEALSPSITLAIADITNFTGVSVDAELGAVEDLADLVYEHIQILLGQLGELVENLAQWEVIDQALPLVDIRLRDALGFVEDFLNSIQNAAEFALKNIQEFEGVLDDIFGKFAGLATELSFAASSPGVLGFEIGFSKEFNKFLPINVDLEALAAEVGVNLPDDILNLAGQANLDAEFSIDVNLSVGINILDFATSLITDPSDPLAAFKHVFLVIGPPSTGGTGFQVRGFAQAENVTFTAALGPFGAFVTNGAAILNDTGALADNNPANLTLQLNPDAANLTLQLNQSAADDDPDGEDTQLSLFELFGAIDGAGLTSVVTGSGGFGIGAVLPVSFPTASNFIGNIAFTASLPNVEDLDSFTYAVTEFPDFEAPEISDLFENLGLLDGLALVIEGMDLTLATLGDLVSGEMFSGGIIGDLPFIGDALEDAGQFFEDLRNNIIQPIQQLLDEAPAILEGILEDIRGTIEDALTSLPIFAGSSVDLVLKDSLGAVTLDFNEAVEFSFDIDLNVHEVFKPGDADVGLDVLGFEILGFAADDPIEIVLDILLDLSLGFSLDDGFFVEFDTAGRDLAASLEVFLPNTFQGRLGFLEVNGKNQTPDAANLFGFFGAEVSNERISFTSIPSLNFDVDFGAGIQLDYELELGVNGDLGGKVFPSLILGDGNALTPGDAFGLAWGFFGAVSPAEQASFVTDFNAQFGTSFADFSALTAQFPDTPEVAFQNLGLSLGSFLSDLIGPVVEFVQTYLGPIDPVLDVLTDPIPVISDLLGDTSLLDLAAKFGVVNPALVTALEFIGDLLDSILALDLSGGDVILPIGSFVMGGDGGVDLSDTSIAGILADPTVAFTQALTTLGDELGLSDDITQLIADIGSFALDTALDGLEDGPLSDAAGGLLGSGGDPMLSFPFLTDISQVFGLLFGRDATLVLLDLPPLEFGFELSIYIPIWGPLGVRLTGGLEAVLDFAFGYDTLGIRKLADGGSALDLFQGFFIADDNPALSGIEAPEITVSGEITAAAALNAVVAEVGVGGGIFANINFDLNDPNGDFKVRFDEILANVFNGIDEHGFPLGLICIFDTSGLIEAHMFAYVEALWGLWRKEWEFGPSLPLLEFTYVCPDPPVLATDLGNGTLRLNMGEFAGDRINGDNVDGDEQFFVRKVDGGVEVWANLPGTDVSFGDAQFYEGNFTTILGKAGEGNDVIDLGGVIDASAGNGLAIHAELHGGSGDDKLIGGAGGDLIEGDLGSDALFGMAGDDEMHGGEGADRMFGGDDDDDMFGELGADVLIGGAGDDCILGGADNDVIDGGADDDVIRGEIGDDVITGGADNDIVDAGSGRDRVWGDNGFTLASADLATLAGTATANVVTFGMDGDPVLIVPPLADHGVDYIAGNGGSDRLYGDGNDDRIWGDSAFSFNPDCTVDSVATVDVGAPDTFLEVYFASDDGDGILDVLLSELPLLLLPPFGDNGNDNISGGGGDDVVFGEAGNDVIRGDDLDDGNQFSAGANHETAANGGDPDPDGNDALVGGKGADWIYGNDGNDNILGGQDNDFLFGNGGDDTADGDIGVDVIFGDNGLVELFQAGVDDINPWDPVGTLYSAFTTDFKRLVTTDPTVVGNDTLFGGPDGDYIFGGPGTAVAPATEDTIVGADGDDIAFGDNGEVKFVYSTALVNPALAFTALNRSFAVSMESIDRDAGGNDNVSGGSGRDIAIGGKGDDTVTGDLGAPFDDFPTIDSRDVLFGDHGLITLEIVPAVRGAIFTNMQSNEDNPTQGGVDTIDGKQQDDFIIGGPAGDTMTGGTGNDIVIGDRGEIVFDHSRIPADAGTIGQVNLRALVVEVFSTDLALTDIPFTGDDTVSGGQDDDVVIGGGGRDTIRGDAENDGTILDPSVLGADILIGDNGRVLYGSSAPNQSSISFIETTDSFDETGGGDFIFGNQGNDIILGSVNGDPENPDELSGEDGNDIILGDQGFLEYNAEGDGSNFDLDLVATDEFDVGGTDLISGGSGLDFVLGGTGDDIITGDDSVGGTPAVSPFDDILFGDQGEVEFEGLFIARIESTDETDADGDSDIIDGNEGDDVVFGGVHDDTIFGGLDDDILFGDEGIVILNLAVGLGGDGNPTTPDIIRTKRNLDDDDTAAPLGSGDFIFGEAGRDVAMGGTGADTIMGDNIESDPVGNPGVYDLAPETALAGLSGRDILIGDQGLVELFDGDPLSDVGATGESAFLNTNATLITATDIAADELIEHGDIIHGNGRGDVLIGGIDSETLLGEAELPAHIPAGLGGDDILLGDEGRLRYNVTGVLPGDEGTGDGNAGTLDLIETFATGDDPAHLGADDILHGDDGNDVAMGGTGGDTIFGDLYSNGGALFSAPAPGTDTLFGDGGRMRFQGGTPNVSILKSIEDGEGGTDTIEGNELGDIIIGGFASDWLYGEAADLSLIAEGQGGRDTILGDNGELSWILASDTIVGRAAPENSITLDADTATLDRITTTSPTLGDDDVIFGNAFTDIILGGTGSDVIWADTNDDNPDDGHDGPDGGDLVFGDHGKLYPTVGTKAQPGDTFFNNFFFSIDTAAADAGDDDVIFGEAGGDILLGGQGDDLLFGAAGDDDLIGGHNISGELGGPFGEFAHDDFDPIDAFSLAALIAEIAAATGNPYTLADLDPSDVNEINDILYAAEGDDVVASDNAVVIRQGINFFTLGGTPDLLSPRFREVVGGELYTLERVDFENLLSDATGGDIPGVALRAEANIGAPDTHLDMTLVRKITLLDHSIAIAQLAAENPDDPRPFGNDLVVGGLNDDELFGELGDDIMQGDGDLALLDGALEVVPVGTVISPQEANQSFNARVIFVPVTPMLSEDKTVRFVIAESLLDGNDYLEGNSGNDRMLGNLGQDDIIGGSSELFGLGGVVALRPDGADLIFGGAANDALLTRNAEVAAVNADGDTIVTAAVRHARDADTILGDNGNIFRIVDPDNTAADFNYDLEGNLVPRAVELVDYQYAYVGAVGSEVLTFTGMGVGDLIYGESGDDTIHGMTGNDVIFGNSEDDDIYGEHGADFLFGSVGIDGILGDDGLIFTRRNSDLFGEPLYGIDPLHPDQGPLKPNDTVDPLALNALISTPGNIQRAIINVEGELVKSVSLFAFRVDELEDTTSFDDIIFGGLSDTFVDGGGNTVPGGDFIHGGDGDDAISGAEALPFYYDATDTNFTLVSDVLKMIQNHGSETDPTEEPEPFWMAFAPYNPGHVLDFEGNGKPAEFAYYDEFSPRRRIMLELDGDPAVFETDAVYDFLLNFDETEGVDDIRFITADEGPGIRKTDGDDRIFGDAGNDWMVGGTGRDNMFGGRGDDMLNMDDDHNSPDRDFKPDPKQTPMGGLENDSPDDYQAYADIAYGGAGRDVLILNTGADRSIDWVGEFNSYIVPFSPFGAFDISRNLQPQLEQFLEDLSLADGADQGLPDGKLYIDQKRADVRTYDPDPLRHYEPFGELGMVRQEDRDWQEQTGAPSDPQAGNLQGPREIMRRELFSSADAVAFAADVGTWNVTSGAYKAAPATAGGEEVSIFHLDKMMPAYTEILVAATAAKDKAGVKSNAYVIFDYQSDTDFKFAGFDAGLDKIQIGHRTAAGWIVDVQSNMQLTGGTKYDITVALHGTVATVYINGINPLSFVFGNALNDGLVGLGANNSVTTFDNYQVQTLAPIVTFRHQTDLTIGDNPFTTQSGQWANLASAIVGTATTGSMAIATQDVSVAPYTRLWLDASVATNGSGGIAFDYYDAVHFKFAVLDVVTREVLVGHVDGAGVVIDARVAATITSGGTYDLNLSIIGTSVGVTLNGNAVTGFSYNSLLNDGAFGLLSLSGSTTFASAAVSGDDPAYLSGSPIIAASAAAQPTGAEGNISSEFLAKVFNEALARYSGNIVLPPEISASVADLPGDLLAFTTADNRILIDGNAAGHGWYVGDSERFTGIDLLSALLHEFGHLSGREHEDAGIMQPTLAPGERLWLDASQLPQGFEEARQVALEASLPSAALDTLASAAANGFVSARGTDPTTSNNYAVLSGFGSDIAGDGAPSSGYPRVRFFDLDALETSTPGSRGSGPASIEWISDPDQAPRSGKNAVEVQASAASEFLYMLSKKDGVVRMHKPLDEV